MRHELCGILVAALGMLTAVGLSSAAAEASDTREADVASIVVRTYTQPDSESAIPMARRTAGAILGRAGIQVVWLECGLPADAIESSDACGRPVQPNELVVRVLSAGTEDRRADVDTLGFAFVDLRAGGGSLATVFADRVRAMAQGAGVDAAELLGRTIAHEAGHLLLGTNRHAAHGLMRAYWSGTELRRNRATQWLFGGEEGEVMRRVIASRLRS
jgi:hypothetical protein